MLRVSSLRTKSSIASSSRHADSSLAVIPVVVIFAPTACGKTALVRTLFGRSGLSPFKGLGEVVSADSQAVYRGMDIGTAKPSAQERAELPHHLLDIVSPDVQFGVGEFLAAADAACRDIWERGKLPLLVGGSGFYVRNFLLGLPVTPESDPTVRLQLKERLAQEGREALYLDLQRVDPESAARIHRHDAYRICRALEVYYTSGRPLSSFALPLALRDAYRFCTVILSRDKKDLYERIDARVEQMFADGLAEEVARLRAAGYTDVSPGMRAIGYSEFFLPGLGLDAIKEKIKADSRNYAKKQYVFMREIPGAVSVPADDSERVLELIRTFLADIS